MTKTVDNESNKLLSQVSKVFDFDERFQINSCYYLGERKNFKFPIADGYDFHFPIFHIGTDYQLEMNSYQTALIRSTS